MSLENVLGTLGNDVKSFYTRLAADLKLARQAWLLISSAQTRSVLLTIGTDVIKLVKDGSAAASATGLSLTLDEAVLADVQKLVTDAKAGDTVIAADLKALGIAL